MSTTIGIIKFSDLFQINLFSSVYTQKCNVTTWENTLIKIQCFDIVYNQTVGKISHKLKIEAMYDINEGIQCNLYTSLFNINY